jgi:hypothetical protein
VYFWDTEVWANVMAMLEPVRMKEQIIQWFSLDLNSCLAIDAVSKKGAGHWYAADDWAIFRTIEAYLEVTGDKSFLNHSLYGKTLIQHLDGIATHYENIPLTEGSLLADYGTSGNLLECSPSYIHGVSSLNAANIYLLRKTAAYHDYTGTASGPEN